MFQDFYKQTNYFSVSTWDARRASEVFTGTLSNKDAILLTATINNLPVGFLMALSHIPMWGYEPLAMETLFWVDPEVRNLGLGRLLKAHYKQWCIEQGCGAYCLGNALGMNTTEQLDKSLKDAGFVPAEAIYASKV